MAEGHDSKQQAQWQEVEAVRSYLQHKQETEQTEVRKSYEISEFVSGDIARLHHLSKVTPLGTKYLSL